MNDSVADGAELTLECAVADGATVVCVSVALARELHVRAAQLPRADTRTVWRTPRIVAWQNWLASLLSEMIDVGAVQGTLLAAAEERVLWHEVVGAWDHAGHLLQHRGAARAAADAARICARFDISDPQLADTDAKETQIFAGWQQSFQAHLHAHDAIAPFAMDDLVSAHLDAVAASLPRQLVLAGFDEINPAGLRVLGRARALGVTIARLADERPAARELQRFEVDDARAQIDAICAWAKNHVERGPNTARLGITAPDLSGLRTQLDAPLTQALAPFPGAYHSTTAQSLGDEPVVHAALTILRACVEPVDAEQLCMTLRPPYADANADADTAAADAWLAHVALECDLLEALPRRVHLTRLLQAWPEDHARADAYAQLCTQLQQVGEQALASVWAQRFAQWLTLCGFQDAAAAGLLTPALVQLANLDRVLARCSATRAVAEFSGIVADTAPPRLPVARVQLLTMDDAAEAHLDALWIAGVDEEQWPRGARPFALLPVRLQVDHHVPGVRAESAAARDRTLTTKLVRAATQVMASHTRAVGDRTLRVSPLFAHVPIASPSTPATDAPDMATSAQDTVLEAVADWHGEPVPEGTHMSGGTRLLADQSECPFRAYAVHRLGATVRDVSGLGLDRRDAGSLLHRALELCWARLKDSASLRALSDTQLAEVVAEASASAVAGLRERVPVLVDPHHAALERRRLTRLCLEWLKLERERPHEFEVLLRERRENARVGPLDLDIQIDRIDRMADGTHAVIDYKSGDVKSAGWFEERLAEPQVPLYATVRDATVSAALIARVKTGAMGFHGAVAEVGVNPSSGKTVRVASDADEWRDWLTLWREQLAALASEVASAVATVTPTNFPQTCRYCDVRPACRIDAVPHDEDDERDPG